MAVATDLRPSLAFLGKSAVLALTALLLTVPRARTDDTLPLTQDEQRAINQAINRGVRFLRASQNPWGTWSVDKSPLIRDRGKHWVGRTALAGLTLIECGVPLDDPGVQLAARQVRESRETLATTYELALAILFLDRLGNPRDEPVIELFALRLIAGQTPSGGWTYNCPVLTSQNHKQLLTVLRQLNPVTAPPAAATNTLTTARAGAQPPPVSERAAQPPAVSERAATAPPSNVATSAERVAPGPSSRSAGNSPGAANYSPGGSNGSPSGSGPATVSGPATAGPGRAAMPAVPGINSPGPANPGGQAAPAPAGPPAVPAAPAVPAVKIPPNLAVLPVLGDPIQQEGWLEPKDKEHTPIAGTTDNSNSQFAILALWVARRHNVPMERTLDLMARRYRRTQNADGGWGYHQTDPTGPAMTCVGLLGLAVGVGLAEDGTPRKPDDATMVVPRKGMCLLTAEAPLPEAEQTPPVVPQPGDNDKARVVKGLKTLADFVGRPAGRMHGLTAANFYFLWSLERVGVLYNLRQIGDKDWYLWGAEILVSNQADNGGWAVAGGYPGQDAILNTCLALLFLKRVNLVADLSSKLPFERIAKEIAEPTPPPPPPPAAPQPAMVEPPSPVLVSITPPAPAEERIEEPPARQPYWLLLLIVVPGLLLLAAVLTFAIYFYVRNQERNAEEQQQKQRVQVDRVPNTGRVRETA